MCIRDRCRWLWHPTWRIYRSSMVLTSHRRVAYRKFWTITMITKCWRPDLCRSVMHCTSTDEPITTVNSESTTHNDPPLSGYCSRYIIIVLFIEIAFWIYYMTVFDFITHADLCLSVCVCLSVCLPSSSFVRSVSQKRMIPNCLNLV